MDDEKKITKIKEEKDYDEKRKKKKKIK